MLLPIVTWLSVPDELVSVLPVMVPLTIVPLKVPRPPVPSCPVLLMSSGVALLCRSSVPALLMLTVPPVREVLRLPKLANVKLPPRSSVPALSVVLPVELLQALVG